MKFLVHIHQAGGCDYTIGCGVKVEVIDADDIVAARARTEHKWFGVCDPEDYDNHGSCRGYNNDVRRSLDSIRIYPLAGPPVELDLKALELSHNVGVRQQKEIEQRKKDEEEFARLQKKLGK